LAPGASQRFGTHFWSTHSFAPVQVSGEHAAMQVVSPQVPITQTGVGAEQFASVVHWCGRKFGLPHPVPGSDVTH
jgi:hypothetical protein